MKYALNKTTDAAEAKKPSAVAAWHALWPFMAPEKGNLAGAFLAIIVNSVLTLSAPLVIAHAIDAYISKGNYTGVLQSAGLLVAMYACVLVTGYLQTTLMGRLGQRVLFRLRNAVFTTLQDLPVAFFNSNKAGDLISRINNDTDKLNQFFSQSLMQFIGGGLIMFGAGIFLIALHPNIGAAALAPAAVVLIVTQFLSGWVKRTNTASMKALGGMSGEIQESLNNFKVVVAFNRRDYFRDSFAEANRKNYASSVSAGIANNIFVPLYGLSANVAQLIVIGYGISLISRGEFTVGLLISFLSYITNFYNPLRQLAAFWSSFQIALAGWDRVSEILLMKSDLVTLPDGETSSTDSVLEFRHVDFRYDEGKDVLRDVNVTLEKGKTYALVGPTGGGKTTTASLMARLYDPTQGTVFLDGKDIRSYESAERAKRIGFILQEPFLFNGTLRENLLYGNTELQSVKDEELESIMKDAGLNDLLSSFKQGLATPISSADAISLGQRQLIAFMRAVLRKPELLILDEASANIDTVTEQLLDGILKKLPVETTRVIIAHRLNTIENADEIFFVNGGEVARAGSMEHAVEMLLKGKRES